MSLSTQWEKRYLLQCDEGVGSGEVEWQKSSGPMGPPVLKEMVVHPNRQVVQV